MCELVEFERAYRCGCVLSDVGYTDPYASTMSAVITSECPNARIEVITHDIPSYDVRKASIPLLMAYKFFPKGTIFVVVVVPGVGINSKPLIVITRNYYFVGPDNGVLLPAALDDGVEEVYVADNERYFRRALDSTFHGRDIYAPIAAAIINGDFIESIGKRIKIDELVNSEVTFQHSIEDGCVTVKVLYVDKYGNVKLSQYFEKVAKELNLGIGDEVNVCSIYECVKAYLVNDFSTSSPDTLVIYEDSFGFIEIAVNRGSASQLLGIDSNDLVKLCPPRST